MFRKLQQRFRDMKTIRQLCEQAEHHARNSGQQEAGAEHFILAALDLPDGTASAAFARLGVDGKLFKQAIAQQAKDALPAVGVQIGSSTMVSTQPLDAAATGLLYQAQASGQSLMQALAAQDKPANIALQGAHVLQAACTAQYGVTIRALRAMGLEPARLAAAAEAEIQAASLAA